MKHIICSVTNDLTYDRRMQRICTSLTKVADRVTLVGRKKKDSQPCAFDHFQYHRIKCYFETGKLFYLEYNLRLLRYLWTQKATLFYAVDLDTILPNLLVSRLRKKKCIYDAHEYFSETPEVVRRPLVQRIWEIVARFCIPRMDYCMTVGSGLAAIMSQRYQTPFGVVRNVPFRYPKARKIQVASAKTKVLLYQGMLNEGRGLEAMILAMKDITAAELWLVGEGDLSESLRKLVEVEQLQQKVKFLGFITPDQLQQITLQADIGLNLLENSGLSYYYSLANKAFDYVQAHLPSIHMNFPAYQSLNQEHEVFCLLDHLQTNSILAAVQRLLQDPNYYRQLQMNCAIAAQEWCWEEEEKLLLEAITHL